MGLSKGVDRGKASPGRANGKMMTPPKTMGQGQVRPSKRAKGCTRLRGHGCRCRIKVRLSRNLPLGNAGVLRSGSRKASLLLHLLRGSGVDHRKTALRPPWRNKRPRLWRRPLSTTAPSVSAQGGCLQGLLTIRMNHRCCRIQEVSEQPAQRRSSRSRRPAPYWCSQPTPPLELQLPTPESREPIQRSQGDANGVRDLTASLTSSYLLKVR
jgi:hypothetical protein